MLDDKSIFVLCFCDYVCVYRMLVQVHASNFPIKSLKSDCIISCCVHIDDFSILFTPLNRL